MIPILTRIKTQGPLQDPPEDYIQTEQVVSPDESFVGFTTDFLSQATNADMNEHTAQQRYQQARLYLLGQTRAAELKKAIAKRRDEIKEILKNGTREQIEELLQQRHQWNVRNYESVKEDNPICANLHCSAFALPGSPFCATHILDDPRQKLYTKCPNCRRPHPVVCDCFYCRKQP